MAQGNRVFTWWLPEPPCSERSFDELVALNDRLKSELALIDSRAELAGSLLVMHHRIIATLAGPIAEDLFTIACTTSLDQENARALAEIAVRSPSAIGAYLASRADLGTC